MHLRGVGRPGAVHSVPAGLAGPAGVCMGSRVRFIHVFYGTSRFRLIRKKNKMTPRWSNGAAIGRLGLQTIGLCPRGPTRPNAAPGCGHTWPNLFCTQPVHYILETPLSSLSMGVPSALAWHALRRPCGYVMDAVPPDDPASPALRWRTASEGIDKSATHFVKKCV